MSSAPQHLVLAIRDTLYTHFFARTSQATITDEPISADEFCRRLSVANQGRDAWLDGWRLREIKPGGVIVARQGARLRFAKPGDYAMTFAEDVPLCVGCSVTIRLRKESLGLQDGTYCALGEESPSPDEEADVLRIYFNAPEEAAVLLVEQVTQYFNEWSVPFTLKLMLRPQDRDRSDATVLYFPKDYYRRFVQLLSEFPESFLRQLGDETPLFTKPLRRGIGLAESPGGGESFGLHRCRLVAEGIVDAWLSGHQDEKARIEATEKRFASEGFSLARPYLNPGSNDTYSTRLDDCPPPPDARCAGAEPIVLTVKNVLAFMRERGWCTDLPGSAGVSPASHGSAQSVTVQARGLRSQQEGASVSDCIITESEVQWRVSEFPSRNRNFGIICTDPERGFFVKQLRVQDPESLAMLRREATIYQLVQQDPDFAALKQFTPAFIAYDDQANVLVLEFVKGETLLKTHRRLEQFPEDSAQKLGVALATLHSRVGRVTSAAPPQQIFPMRPPGIFDAHRNGPLMRWLGPGQRLLLAQIREHVQLAEALDELAATWRCDTFIHGDLKFENCIALAPEAADTARAQITLLDWELAGFGEASWDVGSVLQCFLSASLLAGVRTFSDPAMRKFWESYCNESHLVHESASVLLERSLSCAAARMLQTALEVTQGQSQPTAPALRLFNASVELIDARKRNIFLDHFSTPA